MLDLSTEKLLLLLVVPMAFMENLIETRKYVIISFCYGKKFFMLCNWSEFCNLAGGRNLSICFNGHFLTVV